MLSSIPPHPSPKVELEQYATPADLAAPLLFEARALGDIEGKRVADLGCGTGIFAIGAGILGASHVVAVELDPTALGVAQREAARLRTTAEWVEADVSTWQGEADTVIMNPPFGAQQRHADRAFLDTAMRTAPVVYSLHNAATRTFVESYAAQREFRTTHAWRMAFTLSHQFRHHERASKVVDVVALRLARP